LNFNGSLINGSWLGWFIKVLDRVLEKILEEWNDVSLQKNLTLMDMVYKFGLVFWVCKVQGRLW